LYTECADFDSTGWIRFMLILNFVAKLLRADSYDFR